MEEGTPHWETDRSRFPWLTEEDTSSIRTLDKASFPKNATFRLASNRLGTSHVLTNTLHEGSSNYTMVRVDISGDILSDISSAQEDPTVEYSMTPSQRPLAWQLFKNSQVSPSSHRLQKLGRLPLPFIVPPVFSVDQISLHESAGGQGREHFDSTTASTHPQPRTSPQAIQSSLGPSMDIFETHIHSDFSDPRDENDASRPSPEVSHVFSDEDIVMNSSADPLPSQTDEPFPQAASEFAGEASPAPSHHHSPLEFTPSQNHTLVDEVMADTPPDYPASHTSIHLDNTSINRSHIDPSMTPYAPDSSKPDPSTSMLVDDELPMNSNVLIEIPCLKAPVPESALHSTGEEISSTTTDEGKQDVLTQTHQEFSPIRPASCAPSLPTLPISQEEPHLSVKLEQLVTSRHQHPRLEYTKYCQTANEAEFESSTSNIRDHTVEKSEDRPWVAPRPRVRGRSPCAWRQTSPVQHLNLEQTYQHEQDSSATSSHYTLSTGELYRLSSSENLPRMMDKQNQTYISHESVNLEQTKPEDVIGISDQSGFSRTSTYKGVNTSQQATFDNADQYQGQMGYNNVPSIRKLKTPGLSDVQSGCHLNSTSNSSNGSLQSRVSLQSESNGSNHLQPQSLLSRLSDPIPPHAPSYPNSSLPEVTHNEDPFQPSIWYRLGMKPPSMKK